MTTHRHTLTRLAMIAACFSLTAPVILSTPSVAHAQSDARLKKLLDEGVENYDMLMLDEAAEKLQEGIKAVEKNNTRGPVAAKLYIMMGIVRFAEQKKSQVEPFFVKAAEADPKTDIPAAYKTPELSKIMARARKKAKPAKTNPVKTNPTTTAKFGHKALVKAQAGKPLPVVVNVPSSMPAFRVWLFFRRFGEDKYTRQEMRPDEKDTSRFTVTLPGKEVRTSTMDYYIEAHDRGGKAIATSGTSAKPHNVVLLGASDLPDPGKGNKGNKGNKGGNGDPDPDPKPGKVQDANVYISLGAGSGLGLLTGGAPTANPGFKVKPGVAPAIAHALIDLGWVINPTMSLGLYFRWQFLPGQDFSALDASATEGSFPGTKDQCLGFGMSGDCMLGLKYRYYFEKEHKTRFYSSVGLGVGRTRNWLKLEQPTSTQNPAPSCAGKETFDIGTEQYCYIRDTVRPGWFHLGLGAGISAPITKNLEFVGDSYLMFIFLDQAAIALDATLGLAVKF